MTESLGVNLHMKGMACVAKHLSEAVRRLVLMHVASERKPSMQRRELNQICSHYRLLTGVLPRIETRFDNVNTKFCGLPHLKIVLSKTM